MTEPMGTLYLQVANHLRQQISKGDLAIGDAIPSTAALCAQFGVSATVARAAVKELQAAGLVQGQAGKAVYVISTPEQVEETNVDLHQVADQVTHIREELTDLTDRVESNPAVEALRTEVTELRRQVAQLQGHLIDLYARTGQPYPHESQNKTGPRARRKATGS